ncbi:hypothetical protein SU69_07785 [Thermosipho melanesiensis]|uniref:SLH domain-containing protein n=2 Tax=Thermosipho melanesiensis TaxID=46541 RepID=A6LN77_THEM4|nr:S-layer homology domain-containing protein [Thermosipho melanesiensis]ABR31378.1 hypothetical protein Tmel_1533 [Thermosipho melanesiensis BI429]APT74438.1 hypothetical protein BW47_08140 [Thermosipho melanesiensis]OOC36400.1 hypothetical protein SU68_07855 [Thermosipho melanesiensis]OOC37218.1 hypothetical protein SU69_07785 [Thermosipho melanesiensis]OOC37970.1 hypothetical protein SU70_07795 [Thermosipho melanesiensis]
MRKLFFILLLSSVIVFSAEITITDLSPIVPEYSAVEFLVKNQIMELDINGNFKPSLLMTRLDIARILYTVIQKYNLNKLSEIENLLLDINNELKTSKSAITGIDKRVSLLEDEFLDTRDRFDKLEKFVEKASETILSEDRIKKLYEKIDSMENTYAKVDDLNNLSAQISLISEVFNSQIKKFDEKISDIEKISEIEKKLSILNSELDELKTNFLEEQARNLAKFSKLNEQLGNIPTDVTNLNLMISKISSKVNAIETLYTKLQNLKPEDFEKIAKISEMESKVNEMYSILSDLKAFSGDLDTLRQRLEGIDVLTVRNVVNKFGIMENRYRQLEERMQNLEESVSKFGVYNQKIKEIELQLSEIENKKIALDNIDKISSDVEYLKKSKEETEKVLNVMTDKIVENGNKVNSLYIVSIISMIISIVSLVIVFAK